MQAVRMARIMKLSRPSFYQVFRFLQTCCSMTCSWPLNPNVNKFIFVFREIGYSLLILNLTVMLMSFVYAIYENWHDVTIVMKGLSEFTLLMHLLVNLFIYRFKSARIQHILTEMKNFLLTTEDHERLILQKYIDRYAFISMTSIICQISVIISFDCLPMFTSRKFPADGLYPFPTESLFVRFIIYATHVYVSLHWGLCGSVEFMFALFCLYSAARLEMLYLEIEAAKNERHINSCIKKHQEIIKFVGKTKDIIQYSLCTTTYIMAGCAICSTFPFIYGQSGSFQFVFVVIAGCQRLYITASPADDLMENSERIAMAAYNMSWIGKSQRIIKNMQLIMLRSQRPLIINMGGLLPALTLKYYAKYLMAIFTHFATMRAILEKKK